MDVLGHDNVLHQTEFKAIPHFSKHPHKKISLAYASEQSLSVVATERDEVQMPMTIDTDEFVPHARPQ